MTTEHIKVSTLDAGTKKTWKFYQTLDELETWSLYLQQSATNFIEALDKTHIGAWPEREQTLIKETRDLLKALHKQTASLSGKTRRMKHRNK